MNFEPLLAFIPLFEEGIFKDAESQYLSTGEYLPEMEDFVRVVRESGLVKEDFDWLEWIDEAANYMREPQEIVDADFETVQRLATVLVKSGDFNRELLPFLCAKGTAYQLLLRLRALSA